MDDKFKALFWLPDLLQQVEGHLEKRCNTDSDLLPRLEHEREQLQRRINGWSQSLANPELSAVLRHDIEQQYADALNRVREIEDMISEQGARQTQTEQIVDPDAVLARVEHLADVLAGDSATLGNLELSLHIDRINCSPDGTVIMRTCKLGALTGAVELLAENNAVNDQPHGDTTARQASPRRRGRPRLGDADDQRGEHRALAEFAVDPNRFGGLGNEWFWEDQFTIPETTWPFQEMAIAVATDRLAGLTHEQLASKYGVTTPTIRKSLRYAAEHDERFRSMPKKMARSRWHEEHAAEVAKLKAAEGLSTQQLVEHFGKSDTTIRAALTHAYQLNNGGADA